MNIVVISEADLKLYTGYTTIATTLCAELHRAGHHVVMAGISYEGQPHDFPIPIIPIGRDKFYKQAWAMVHNLDLTEDFRPDVVLSICDIPLNLAILANMQDYLQRMICVFPMEAPPLTPQWAVPLTQAKMCLTMSQFAADECNRVGVPAKHMPIPINVDAWRRPSANEKAAIKTALGIPLEQKVVLTVAENQERKNLSGTVKVVAEAAKSEDFKFVLVTRMFSEYGWSMEDMLMDYGIRRRTLTFEKGLPFAKLWSLFAIADAFLLTSKAEGLGLPVLEAMSCGVPVVAPNHTSFKEHLGGGTRGWPFAIEYTDTFVYGNEDRYYCSIDEGAKALVACLRVDNTSRIEAASRYVRSRTWLDALKVFHEVA